MTRIAATALLALSALVAAGCGADHRSGACGMACCAETKADCATCATCATSAKAAPACEACVACPMPESATAAPAK
jgi:hypothetical protein